jgi:aerobic carbon-monoxide dehydrogenase medium subunit
VIPAAFDLYVATSIDDAVGRLSSLGDESRVLAGGHSLIPFMKLRFAVPEALVDINGITDLAYVRRDGDRVRVGALTRHAALASDPVALADLPLLALTASKIGDPQVRNRGTIGGAIAHADPAGEFPTVCLMLDADIVTTRRTIPASEFFLGRYTTPLDHDELLLEVVFPAAPAGHGYIKFAHNLFDWALLGVAVQRMPDDGWRVGLVNVGDTPIRAVAVEQALAAGATASEAAARASDGLSPLPTLRAPVDYQLHLSRVLTERALVAAGA